MFTAVGQNLYIDKFSSGLQRIGGLHPKHILDGGATDLGSKIPAALRLPVLTAYNDALTKGTFLAALVVACLAIPAAFGMEWRSVKDNQRLPSAAAKDEEKIASVDREVSPKRTSERPSTSSQGPKIVNPVFAPPAPAWERFVQSNAKLHTYLTAKLNPDIRDEILATYPGPGH